MDLVDNAALRAAVMTFAADPDPSLHREVILLSASGDLLLDATGSDLHSAQDDGAIAAGSTLGFREGVGPDGKRALFAFTRQAEAQKMHDDGAATTVRQRASDVLELVVSGDYSWLYIDPFGPTCGISREDVELVLRDGEAPDVSGRVLAEDDGVTISEADDIPAGMEAALSNAFSRLPEIASAYLGWKVTPAIGDECFLLIVVGMDGVRESVGPALSEALGPFSEDHPVDVMYVLAGRDHPLSGIAPFYAAGRRGRKLFGRQR